MFALVNVLFTLFICFYFKWLERVKQGKLCKYYSNEDVCCWLFQIHALYLWEVDSLSCYLMKQQPKTYTTTFPYKNSDPWKSSLYISISECFCYGQNLYFSLIEIHCGASTSASWNINPRSHQLWAQVGRVRKVLVLLMNLRTV